MPDSKAGSWAAINGQEIVNAQRTAAYIVNFGLPLQVSEDCWCPQLPDLLVASGCASNADVQSVPYYLPASDPAPWFDVAIPESGGFLGFLPVEFDGLGSTYTRDAFDVLQGGAVLGRLRPQARTVTWRGYLIGTSCCSAEYGLRWLTQALASSAGCNGCDDAELDFLLCCVDLIECDNCDPAAGNGPASNAFRTLHKVGLVDGPTKLSQRSIGCGGACDDCSGCLIEVEFSIIAGNPFLHKDPVLICGPTLFPICAGCSDDASNADLDFWEKINTLSYPATEDDTVACKNKLECTASPADCNIDPNCPTADLPVIPEVEDPCGCESIFVTENCCHISNDVYGQFFEGIPQIEIYSGDRPMQNVTVRFYENPQERDCADKDLFDICNLCDYLTVRYIPPESTLNIDGLTKRVSITCPGDNVQPAESLMVSNFRWPVLKCIDYIVKISADCCLRSAISFVKVSSSGVNINTFTGSGSLFIENTGQFPATGGTIKVELNDGTTKTLTYTGISGSALTGVNSNGGSGVLNTGDRVTGPEVDPDCSQGVSPNASTTIKVIPREM